ncbi:MAG: DUF2603 domain-containing protein [Campylobacterales bacterium]|nr:DUF2603 domain-containing protein [Campylobacterales bacterium]
MSNGTSNDIELLDKIKTLSENMGYADGEKTIFEIKSTDDPNIKQLILQSGRWDDDKPMFAFDTENIQKAYVFIPSENFAQLLNALRTSKEENFNLKLEKTIWRYVPVDFEDVWVVAMDQIKKTIQNHKGNKPVSINLDQLIADIKKEHPSLFVNLKDYYPLHLPHPSADES